eukprot:3111505-Prorocentrum_lima.AAC.1
MSDERKEELSRARQKAKEYRELHSETEEMFASLKKAKEDLDREKVRRERVSIDKNAPPPTPYRPTSSGGVSSST